MVDVKKRVPACDSCIDSQTYPCASCHEDIALEYIKSHDDGQYSDYRNVVCPFCREAIDLPEENDE